MAINQRSKNAPVCRPSRAALFCLAVVFSAGAAAAQPASEKIEPQLKEPGDGLSLWWTGNAGWLMQYGGVLLGVDLILEEEPFLEEFSMDVRYARPLRAAELVDLDYSLVTHSHGDHFGRVTSRILLEKSRCRFILPRSCLEVADELGIPEHRRVTAVAGEELRLEGVTLRPLHALHGDRFGSVYREATFDDCGYVIDFGGTRVLHPGDSVLLQEQLQLRDITVLLVSITEHNTWIEDSARLANALRPKLILPMHYDTYTKDIFWTVGEPEKVRALLDGEMKTRFRPVRQGERIRVTP